MDAASEGKGGDRQAVYDDGTEYHEGNDGLNCIGQQFSLFVTFMVTVV